MLPLVTLLSAAPAPLSAAQFDVLWEQLTGREHLLLFGAIKGADAAPTRGSGWRGALAVSHLVGGCEPTATVPLPSCLGPAGLRASERGGEAARLLEDVKLTEAAGVRAGAYSGGMKRRLSVAIALLGDPQVGGSAAQPRRLGP